MGSQGKVRHVPITGQIRGGGGGIKGNAQEAIAAIRNARVRLGEGPRFKDVDGIAINKGTASVPSRPACPAALHEKHKHCCCPAEQAILLHRQTTSYHQEEKAIHVLISAALLLIQA